MTSFKEIFIGFVNSENTANMFKVFITFVFVFVD